MADNQYTDFAKRAAAIISEALPTIDVKHYFLYHGATFPYVVMRLGPSQDDFDSAEIELEDRDLIIRFVLGHVSNGYEGESEDNLGTYIDAIKDAFAVGPFFLTSTAYPTGATYLYADGAVLGPDSGLISMDSYLGTFRQIGVEFPLQATFFRKTDIQE